MRARFQDKTYCNAPVLQVVYFCQFSFHLSMDLLSPFQSYMDGWYNSNSKNQLHQKNAPNVPPGWIRPESNSGDPPASVGLPSVTV
jgi:hypothetical protein